MVLFDERLEEALSRLALAWVDKLDIDEILMESLSVLAQSRQEMPCEFAVFSLDEAPWLVFSLFGLVQQITCHTKASVARRKDLPFFLAISES